MEEVKEKKPTITDEQRCEKWRSMLKVFESINPNSEESKQEYSELKEAAMNTNLLTPRQREGIIDRCDNAINGKFGNTKTADQISQEHNYSVKK